MRQKLYFPIRNPYRRFHPAWWAHWLDPRIYWNTLVAFYQRGTRGWAYCDTWDLASYLCDVIIPALEYLKETKHGIPIPEDAVMDQDTMAAAEEEEARWERLWSGQLDEMIAGFKAAAALIDGPPVPCDTHIDSFGIWEKEQDEIRKTGFAAFSKHFFALWD